jgi:hypothetical protein
MAKFSVGSKIQWKWVGRPILGSVEEVFTESVTRTIKGSKIVRHGTKDNPAYLVKSTAGNIALKLETEISVPDKAKSKRPTPSLFRS